MIVRPSLMMETDTSYSLLRHQMFSLHTRKQKKCFPSTRTRGYRLQEAPNIVIWLGNFWYFGRLVHVDRILLISCHSYLTAFDSDDEDSMGPWRMFIHIGCPFESKKKQKNNPLYSYTNNTIIGKQCVQESRSHFHFIQCSTLHGNIYDYHLC